MEIKAPRYHLVICKKENKLNFTILKYYIMVKSVEVVTKKNIFHISHDGCFFKTISEDEFNSLFTVVDSPSNLTDKLECVIISYNAKYNCDIRIKPFIENDGYFYSYNVECYKIFGKKPHYISDIKLSDFMTYDDALRGAIKYIKQISFKEFSEIKLWLNTFYSIKKS